MISLPALLTPLATLPKDAADAVLVGRIWLPEAAGPAIVKVSGDDLIDLTHRYAKERVENDFDTKARSASGLSDPDLTE